jgi:hypothetical protein
MPQYRTLTDAMAVRNRLAHGFAPGDGVTQSLSQSLLDTVGQLLRRERAVSGATESISEVGVEEIVNWFLSEFENPAEHVPYKTAEGGYQYYAGGPYDARDEISDQFSDVRQEVIDEAVDRIEQNGTEWVRKGDY